MMRSRRCNRRGTTGRSGPGPARAAAGDTASFIPDALTIAPRHLEVGADWTASFAVTGFPREVQPGWLQPLLTYPGRVDVALHIEPIDPVTAAQRLRRQLAKLESGRRYTQDKGRLLDPQVEAATEDAYDLSARVARGEGKLYRLGLYLTVRASGHDQLLNEVAAVRSLAASLLLDAKPTTYRSLQGWLTCLPMALDLIKMRRTFDTAALSAAFPFTSPDLPPPDPTSVAAPSGVLYGYNVGSQGLVHWDRFALDNHNAVVLGRSGAGKSYLVKLEALRSLYRGIEVHVIDPEDEYARLTRAVGGAYVHLGAGDVRVNPFDLPVRTRADGRLSAPRDALVRRSLFMHTVLAVLLGGAPSPQDRAVLDRAIAATYQQAGITADPRTWIRPAPLLADLAAALQRTKDRAATALADRLHPFIRGAFSELFAGPTTTRPEGHLVAFSLRDLADELKPIGTLLTLDTVWRQVSDPSLRRPRLVVVDEAWTLYEGARRGRVPLPYGQGEPQALGGTDRRHPGHGRRPLHRSGQGRRRQCGHPNPAASGTAGHRRDHPRLQSLRRRAAVPLDRGPRPGPIVRQPAGGLPSRGLGHRALPGHHRSGRTRRVRRTGHPAITES